MVFKFDFYTKSLINFPTHFGTDSTAILWNPYAQDIMETSGTKGKYPCYVFQANKATYFSQYWKLP